MVDKYYVYEWFNTDSGYVFYVGKGCKDRYKTKRGRNLLFKEYVSNNPVDSRIVKFFDKEDEAFLYEQQLTDKYRTEGMCSCNLIDGGYGGYSSVWNEEARTYKSLYNPMKQESQKERMRKHNPMFNKETALAVADKNRRKVVIDGIEFSCAEEASKVIGVHPFSIYRWCKRGYSEPPENWLCYYKDETLLEKDIKDKTTTCSKAVVVDDNHVFFSLKGAADFLGAKDASPLCKCLKHNKTYKGHSVKYANQQPS